MMSYAQVVPSTVLVMLGLKFGDCDVVEVLSVRVCVR